MNPIPPAASAAMRAAAEDYRLTTPPDQATPAGVAQAIGEYLVSSGYEVRPALSPAARITRALRRLRHTEVTP